MKDNITEYYTLVSDLKTEQEFEADINSRYQEYGTLFDIETIALLICDELGRNTQNMVHITDLQPGMECTLIASIQTIPSVRTFTRSNGSIGRVANLTIYDPTGVVTVVLWDEDTQLIEERSLHEHMQIKIINGYTKQGYTGLEITVGKWSSLEIISDDTSEAIPQVSQHNKTKQVTGTIQHIGPTNVFFKQDGTYGFVAPVTLKTMDGIKQLTLWDEQVKKFQQFKKGDTITITNLDLKRIQGETEYHVNGHACCTRA